jgi:hypothetical protein
VSALFGLAGTASAQFSGAYAPGQWTLTHSVDDNGNVDTTAAPTSITLFSSDNSAWGAFGDCVLGNCAPSSVAFTVVAAQGGVFSFDWSYASQDTSGSALWYPAGYSVNGLQVQLSDDNSGTVQGGHVSFSVAQGAVIGFYAGTLDNTGGTAGLTISNFTAPVPEPASMLLMAAGLAGLGVWRRRSSAAR